ncbi:DUF4982 domain-containing protein [Rheinheimera aquimaris]|nr:beta-galactosidase GalB [Rheinheimera aquimaris]MCB5213760.1 DUF4982 domain-containing protein [Rheinheimera aquimaris]
MQYTILILLMSSMLLTGCSQHQSNTVKLVAHNDGQVRQRILLDDGWRFYNYGADMTPDALIYDIRPVFNSDEDDKAADAEPTAAAHIDTSDIKHRVLKPWILPTANDFIADTALHHLRPEGNPGSNFAFVQPDFDDSNWQSITVPHDWAITGPFYTGDNAVVGGGMGRLPSPGVAWYRRSFTLNAADRDKAVYLDIDGAMSYAMVWINGHLAGGWPYGYASWRLDLTPYLLSDQPNQLAVRLDNPPASSRWYPGGGLYRNVWLTKTNKQHIAHWGTTITTTDVSAHQATVHIRTEINNRSADNVAMTVKTEIYPLDEAGAVTAQPVARLKDITVDARASGKTAVIGKIIINNPKLWGPPPQQQPNRYLALTTLWQGENLADQYETRFGIRDIRFDAKAGVIVNGQPVHLQGVNQHHDLGALGAAFNLRAAKRQLLLLREMGVNAIRMAHNPPAPELLDLTDEMGFLVINEIFDSWRRKKTPLDFHLIFPDWSEADLRAFIRRDRNHPSVIAWSIGNEVGEQYTAEEGAAEARRLHNITQQEDPTRPTAAAMNYAKAGMPFAGVMDIISLNYQGEGIRDAPAYAHLQGIRTAPAYASFKQQYPDKLILSSENAAAVSSRGEYFFPVNRQNSAPVADGAGGDPTQLQVSGYELYSAEFGSSADKVLASMAQHPYVAGGFIWSGWDYLGEPTPYYQARSSYFGVIDLAGFKKNRFYLYQSQWRPELPMAHILPHWNWPDRVGLTTPVHVFTSGDEAELFLNGVSLGRQKKLPGTVRLRWDDVIYQPGKLSVKTYKGGMPWAMSTVETTGQAAALSLSADRSRLQSDGSDLSFITVEVLDSAGRTVPNANTLLSFYISGPGKIVATDNGDASSLVSFSATQRQAFNGLALVIVKTLKGQSGTITLQAHSSETSSASITLNSH